MMRLPLHNIHYAKLAVLLVALAAAITLAVHHYLANLIAAQEMPPFPQTYTPFAADKRRTLLGAWTSRPSFDGTTEKTPRS